MKTKEKVDKTGCERSGAKEHATSLLTLQFFSHWLALLGKHSLYIFDSDKLLKMNAVRQLQTAASAFSLVFASLWHEVAKALHKR